MDFSLLDAAYDAIEHRDAAGARSLIIDFELRGASAADLGDLWWHLAQLFDALESLEDAVLSRLKAWDWDRQIERPGWSLSTDECQRIVDAALTRLPARAQEILASFPIILDAAPTREMVQQGMDPRLLGFFQGVAHPHKSVLDASPLGPDTIVIYLLNLENACVTQEEFIHELKKTVWHETAHAFGLDEDEVHALGLG